MAQLISSFVCTAVYPPAAFVGVAAMVTMRRWLTHIAWSVFIVNVVSADAADDLKAEAIAKCESDSLDYATRSMLSSDVSRIGAEFKVKDARDCLIMCCQMSVLCSHIHMYVSIHMCSDVQCVRSANIEHYWSYSLYNVHMCIR